MLDEILCLEIVSGEKRFSLNKLIARLIYAGVGTGVAFGVKLIPQKGK